MRTLSGLKLNQLEDIMQEMNATKFRAKQIHNWIYSKSVSTIDEIDLLPKANSYLLKPVNGYGGYGIIESSYDNLINLWNENYVIQPKIDFDSELQFYFIGNKNHYC